LDAGALNIRLNPLDLPQQTIEKVKCRPFTHGMRMKKGFTQGTEILRRIMEAPEVSAHQNGLARI
jgi:hypothetical protein